jgi:hypothetical protein
LPLPNCLLPTQARLVNTLLPQAIVMRAFLKNCAAFAMHAIDIDSANG